MRLFVQIAEFPLDVNWRADTWSHWQFLIDGGGYGSVKVDSCGLMFGGSGASGLYLKLAACMLHMPTFSRQEPLMLGGAVNHVLAEGKYRGAACTLGLAFSLGNVRLFIEASTFGMTDAMDPTPYADSRWGDGWEASPMMNFQSAVLGLRLLF